MDGRGRFQFQRSGLSTRSLRLGFSHRETSSMARRSGRAAPETVCNLGIAEGWEAVLQGQAVTLLSPKAGADKPHR